MSENKNIASQNKLVVFQGKEVLDWVLIESFVFINKY